MPKHKSKIVVDKQPIKFDVPDIEKAKQIQNRTSNESPVVQELDNGELSSRD